MKAARLVGFSLMAAVLWGYFLHLIFWLAGVLWRRRHPRSAIDLLDADLAY